MLSLRSNPWTRFSRTRLMICKSRMMTSRDPHPSNTSRIASIPCAETSWPCISGALDTILSYLNQAYTITTGNVGEWTGRTSLRVDHRRPGAGNRALTVWARQWVGWPRWWAARVYCAAGWLLSHPPHSPHQSVVVHGAQQQQHVAGMSYCIQHVG